MLIDAFGDKIVLLLTRKSTLTAQIWRLNCTNPF